MDVIQQTIEGIGSLLAKMLFDKSPDGNHYQIIVQRSENVQNYALVLNALVSDGKYNEAENYLFELLQSTYDFEVYFLGLEFFNNLAHLSDAQLAKGNYSREEIAMGLEDLKGVLQQKWKKE